MLIFTVKYLKYRALRLAQKQKLTDFLDRIILKNKKFCIVSNNCWSLGIYHNLNKPYNTPFVGLVVKSADFIKMLKNLEHYMSINLSEKHFIPHEEHPVADLDGVILYFVHYKNIEECISKWNRRKNRLNAFIQENGVNSVIFKCCDLDSVNKKDYCNFESLNIKRGIYIQCKDNSILLDKYSKVPGGPELYRARILYYRKFLSLFMGL